MGFPRTKAASPRLYCATPPQWRPGGVILFAGGIGLLLLCWILLSGCATDTGGATGFNLMITDRAPFCKTGPNQDVPDRYLEAGTRVRIVGTTDESARVVLVSGESGFVPANDVGPAPDESASPGPP